MNKQIKNPTFLLRSRRGFLLIEILLTIIIISVGLTVIVQSLGSSLRGTRIQAEYSLVAILMENKMFDILKSPVSELHEKEDAFEEPFDRYQYALKAEAPVEEELEGIDIVSLDIYWPKSKKSRQVSLKTYLFAEEEEEEE